MMNRLNVNWNFRTWHSGHRNPPRFRRRQSFRRQRGFSLVELGVVLLVVSILVGGVLKGRELIGLSKLQRLEKDLDSLQASISLYRDYYQYLPGDDPSASQRFASHGNVIDGNGDYSIDFSSDANSESKLFWQHLRAARLLKVGANDKLAPRNPFGGEFDLRQDAYGMSGLALVATGMQWEQAFALDQRQDDANSGQGQIRIGRGDQVMSVPPSEANARVEVAIALKP